MKKSLATLLVAWGLTASSLLSAQQTQPAATQPQATQPAAPNTSQFLIALTTDSNKPADRLAAAQKLLELKAFPDLQGVLAKGSPAARTIVCQAMRSAPPPELIDGLIAQLADGDASVVTSASQALAAYQDSGASAKLSAVARDGSKPAAVRVSAVRTLGLMHRNVQALKALVAIIEDPKADPAIRDASWQALLGEEYHLLVAAHLDLMNKHMAKLDAAGQEKLQLENLKSPISAIRQMGLEWAHKQKAANTLKADSPIVTQVRSMLGDSEAAVRLNVLELLTAVKDPNDAKGILAQLPKEQVPAVRRAMFAALGALGDPAAIGEEIKALKDPNDDIAVAAAGALGQLCANVQAAVGKKTISAEVAQQAAAALLELGKTPDAGRRHAEAFSAMAKMGDPSFAPVFTAMAKHKTVAIRQQAIAGIRMIGDPKLLASLRAGLAAESDPTVRLAIVEALGQLGKTDEDLALLHGRLDPKNEADEKVRGAAASALMKVLDARAPADILAWAAKFDPKSDERVALLGNAEAKLAKAKSANPAELTACRVELADAYAAQGKAADAATFYGAALENHLSSKTPDAKQCVALTAKLIPQMMASAPLDKATDAVAKYAASKVPGVRDQVAGSLLAYVQASAGDPGRVIQLVDALTAKVPDRFGGQTATQLAAAEATAVLAVVNANLPLLKDAAKKEAAAKALVALGKRAVKPLAQQWKAILAAEKPDTALEGLLIEVLAQIEPAAKDTKHLANKQTKEALIATLLK